MREDLREIALKNGFNIPASDDPIWFVIFTECLEKTFDEEKPVASFFSNLLQNDVYPEPQDLLALSKDNVDAFSVLMSIMQCIECDSDEQAKVPQFFFSFIEKMNLNILIDFISKEPNENALCDYRGSHLLALFYFSVCLSEDLYAPSYSGLCQRYNYAVLILKILSYIIEKTDLEKSKDTFFKKFESCENENCAKITLNLARTVWKTIKLQHARLDRRSKYYSCYATFYNPEEYRSALINLLCLARNRFRDYFSDNEYRQLTRHIKKITTLRSYGDDTFQFLAALLKTSAMIKVLPADVWIIIFTFQYGLKGETIQVLVNSTLKSYQYPRQFVCARNVEHSEISEKTSRISRFD